MNREEVDGVTDSKIIYERECDFLVNYLVSRVLWTPLVARGIHGLPIWQ
jgi:hypothetical protein